MILSIISDPTTKRGREKMYEKRMDLATTFCGVTMPNPFLLASAPPTAFGHLIKRAFTMGWGGAVTKTLKPDGMEISDAKPRFATVKAKSGEIVGFQNFELVTKRPLQVWLQEIKEIKEQFPVRALIGSIMAEVDKKQWQDLAYKVEKAGADALELNFSCPHGMPERNMGAAIGQDPELTETITGWVKEAVDIPVIVKLSPNVTDIALIGKHAARGGADGLAAINTVQSMIGVDIHKQEPLPSVGGYSTFGGLSGFAVKPIGLRCIAQLNAATNLPLSGMGGIANYEHAIEYLLLGASNVQICTQVMIKGFGIIQGLTSGLVKYMQKNNYSSVEEMVGVVTPKLIEHSALERSNLVASINKDWCVGCGECKVVCNDAGYGAIEELGEKEYLVHADLCDGCSLCTQVCRRKAISLGEEKIEKVVKDHRHSRWLD
jgi:dihydropyrimidine dehydrogenase (NAD+) subunit PreA